MCLSLVSSQVKTHRIVEMNCDALPPPSPPSCTRAPQQVMAGVRASSPVKQALFWRAYNAKVADLEKGELTKVTN